MSLPVAILAGGLATRLRPITETIPKSLVEVAGKPFAVHQIELLRANGVNDIVFCVGHLGEMVQQTLGDGSRWGVQIRYVFDGPTLLGTGGALQRAVPFLSEAFFVLYGDSYLECNYQAVAAAFQQSGKHGLMTVLKNNDRWDRSNVLFDGTQILKYDKSQFDQTMQHIDYGLGVLHRSTFAPYPVNERLDLATLYSDLLAKGELAAFEVTERFYEIGSISGLEETRQHLALKETKHDR